MILLLLHLGIQVVLVLRVLVRPHRDPSARVAWIVVLLAVPVMGMVAYLLFGETDIGRARANRYRRLVHSLPHLDRVPGIEAPAAAPALDDDARPLFAIARSISGFAPHGGNSGRLIAEGDPTIEAIVADIDAAKAHVHIAFYIWLPDGNGTKVAEALMRAAGRGVVCRALVDDLGSRALIRSPLWHRMTAAGVRLARALPVGNPLLRVLTGRIDLRNHRKIVVIDNRITYCGSQNCADPAFLPKKKFAPWVDAMIRFEGPVVRQNQCVFASDWMAEVDEDLEEILSAPIGPVTDGFGAAVVATGPTGRSAAMPEMFTTLIYAARRELVVSTPYYVPVEAMQAAFCAAARRGVDVTVIFPARNDDFAVGGTSRSYYAALLEAGVKIHEFQPGLLHTKSLTLDGTTTLIGSANMDRRSFDLNYENNILFVDEALTRAVRERQESYLARSRPIEAGEVARWSLPRRLWNNALAIVGPLL